MEAADLEEIVAKIRDYWPGCNKEQIITLIKILPKTWSTWHISTKTGLSRRLGEGALAALMTVDDSWWHMMTLDDTWWRLITFDDAWWCLMMLDDAWWCLMMLDDSWWCLMTLDDTWWCLITLDGTWWCLIIINTIDDVFFHVSWCAK